MFFLQTASIMILLFSFSGLLGYLLSKFTKLDAYLPSIFIINLPVYIIMGFSLLILFLTAMGLFTIGLLTLVILIVVLLFSFLIVFSGFRKKASISYVKSHLFTIDNIFPSFLFSTVFYFFLNKMDEMLWPPVGDVTSSHGPLVSTFLFNGRLTLSLEPLAPYSLYYPPGFHVLAANIASWFDILPGEAILLVAGSTIVLVFWLMYSLTYMYTRSKLLSTAVFLSPFVFHPSAHLSRWIVGFFYNGTYPSLLAILLATFSITILALLDTHANHDKRLVLGITLWQLITMLTLLVVYPPFLLVIMLVLIYLLFRHHGLYRSIFMKNYKIITVLLIVMLFVLSFELIYFDANVLFSRLQQHYLNASPAALRRAISFRYFYDHITGFAMIFAFIASFLFLLRKNYISISFIYVSSFILLLLSLIDPTILYTDVFLRIVHQRFHMIPWLTSWTIIALGIYSLVNRFTVTNIIMIKMAVRSYSSISEKKFTVHSSSILFSLCFFILTSLFVPNIIHQYTITPNRYTASSSWAHDYEGLIWIHNNVHPDDLILNDYSWAGLWILSFSYKNTTSNRHMSKFELDRTRDLNKVWEGTMSPYEVYQALTTYNVTYIFTTSEWGYYRWNCIWGEPSKYVRKPLEPSQYIELFNSYPFLRLRFQSGYTSIYEVNHKGTFVPIKISGLNFDGIDDYVSVPDSARLKFGSGDFTLELWLKTTETKKSTFFLSKFETGTAGGWGIRKTETNNVQFFVRDSESVTVTIKGSVITDGNWWHIVGARRGNTFILYENGVFRASVNKTLGNTDSTLPLYLGSLRPLTTFTCCTIDHVRIYNRALTRGEIKHLYEHRSPSNTTGLVMELLFNEGKGDVAYDTSGKLNHGAIYGATYTSHQIMSWREEP